MINEYEAIDSHIRKLKHNMYTSLPAKVVKVNTNGSFIESVDIKPEVYNIYVDGLMEEYPTVKDVPVLFPSGGGGLLSFPISEGDTVLVLFTQQDIENFLEGSGKTPKTNRRFNINDAVAIPCLYPLDSNLDPNADDVELKFKDNTLVLKNDGSVQVKTKSTFSVTNDTFELIALLSDFLNDCSSITTPTIFGGTTPINNLSSFTALKAKIDTMKEG